MQIASDTATPYESNLTLLLPPGAVVNGYALDVDGHVASIASGTFVQPVARPTAAPAQPPAERELPDHGATTDEGEGR